MKRSYYYLPLTIALIFGLAINLIASSAVYSDTLTGCQGSGSSTASVILGGRVITPSTLLRAANGQPCGANESSLNLVTLNRTVIVSPNGTPAQNGTALLSAMNTISNANPSATNPWLLKLEPGLYDMGNNALKLLPYVDLEGSGEGTTTISSTVVSSGFPLTNGTLMMASNSEARFVKVVNGGTGAYTSAVMVGSNMSNVQVTHLTTSLSGSQSGYGLFNDGGKLIVQDSTLNGTGTTNSYALVNSTVTATLTLKNSTLSGDGGNSGFGLINKGGTANVINSTLNAHASAYSYAMQTTDGGTSNIQNSALFTSAVNYGYGLFNNNGSSTVKNSILSGVKTGMVGTVGIGVAAENDNGTIKIGASQLSGSSSLVIGTVTCAASYDVNYAALSSSCS